MKAIYGTADGPPLQPWRLLVDYTAGVEDERLGTVEAIARHITW
jgi:hypothetical protein